MPVGLRTISLDRRKKKKKEEGEVGGRGRGGAGEKESYLQKGHYSWKLEAGPRAEPTDMGQMASAVEEPKRLGVAHSIHLPQLNCIFKKNNLRILGYGYINKVARQEKKQRTLIFFNFFFVRGSLHPLVPFSLFRILLC